MIHAYLTKPLYLQALCHELEGFSIVDEALVTSTQLIHPAFALDIWPHCEILIFTSINDAIKQLKARSLRWHYYGSRHFRRGALIAEGLKIVKERGKPFAVFTLLSENELLVCKKPWKQWPCGEPHFIENKEIPPNRAYLKLWEALDLLGVSPKKGEHCLDLGASPGGWTWVLASTDAQVLAIDKAPLDPKIAAMPNVQWQEGSAFAVKPYAVDWLCSDIICYPERALALIQAWLPYVKHLICTIKLQGEIDWPTIAALQAIPAGRVTHLFQNKHELSFLWPFSY